MSAEPKEEFWTTRDGHRLAVGEMDLDHLRNVLRMVLRNRRRLRSEIERKKRRQATLEMLFRRFDKGEEIDFTLDLDGGIDWDFAQPVMKGSSP